MSAPLATSSPLPHALSRALDRATGARPIPGNALRHIPDSRAALDCMLELVDRASRYVHFENFIVRDDGTGRRFAAAWAARARAGARVRLLYDSLGCRGTPNRYWRDLRRAGVDVRAFRPVWTTPLAQAFSRDHRKVLIVDGERAMTGGLCIGDEWAGGDGRRSWRDTMMLVYGPAVTALDRAFSRMWARAGPPIPEDEIADASEESGPTAVRVVEGDPGRSRIYRAVQLLAATVTERLWITDAYLIAPPPLYAALVDAARSGVDVRFLLPGTSDIPIVRLLSRGGYRELLHAGARIFEYQGPMLHAKTLLADRGWVRIGSSNLNLSSLLGNYELDLVIEGDALSDELAAQFLLDMAESREVVLQARRRLPPRLVAAATVPAPSPAGAAAVAALTTTAPTRRTRRELQAAAVVAFVHAAGGVWRMMAGAGALLFALIGVLLVVLPTLASAVLAVAAFGTSLVLAGYAVARRRRRRESDVR